jgi:GTPase Era involved in 16S rRNA processing
MFLRNADIAVVCYAADARHSWAQVDEWVKMVLGQAANAQIILTATKVDRLAREPPPCDVVTATELREKAAALNAKYVQTSAQTKQGIATLKDLIREAAAAVAQVTIEARTRPELLPAQESRCC